MVAVFFMMFASYARTTSRLSLSSSLRCSADRVSISAMSVAVMNPALFYPNTTRLQPPLKMGACLTVEKPTVPATPDKEACGTSTSFQACSTVCKAPAFLKPLRLSKPGAMTLDPAQRRQESVSEIPLWPNRPFQTMLSTAKCSLSKTVQAKPTTNKSHPAARLASLQSARKLSTRNQ